MNIRCKKQIDGIRGDILFHPKKEYEPIISDGGSVTIKDEIGCLRSFAKDDAFFKKHFEILE